MPPPNSEGRFQWDEGHLLGDYIRVVVEQVGHEILRVEQRPIVASKISEVRDSADAPAKDSNLSGDCVAARQLFSVSEGHVSRIF